MGRDVIQNQLDDFIAIISIWWHNETQCCVVFIVCVQCLLLITVHLSVKNVMILFHIHILWLQHVCVRKSTFTCTHTHTHTDAHMHTTTSESHYKLADRHCVGNTYILLISSVSSKIYKIQLMVYWIDVCTVWPHVLLCVNARVCVTLCVLRAYVCHSVCCMHVCITLCVACTCVSPCVLHARVCHSVCCVYVCVTLCVACTCVNVTCV